MFKLFTNKGTLHEIVWVIKQNEHGVSNIFTYIPPFDGTEGEEEYFGGTVHAEKLIIYYGKDGEQQISRASHSFIIENGIKHIDLR
jgi:hypothetical protein